MQCRIDNWTTKNGRLTATDWAREAAARLLLRSIVPQLRSNTPAIQRTLAYPDAVWMYSLVPTGDLILEAHRIPDFYFPSSG
jgi:hypothetical protein